MGAIANLARGEGEQLSGRELVVQLGAMSLPETIWEAWGGWKPASRGPRRRPKLHDARKTVHVQTGRQALRGRFCEVMHATKLNGL